MLASISERGVKQMQDRTLRSSLVLLGLVTFVTAWFSTLFYFPDEHYQVLEFMGLKLGITAPAELPWEYGAHIRPWTQSFIYYALARGAMALGLNDLFAVTFVLQLLTGLFSLAGLSLFARSVMETMERDEKQAFASYLLLLGFLPYLFVRTSSETFAAAFFTAGLAVAMRGRALFWAGVLCGLAFDSRYQAGIMIAGLAAWLFLIARAHALLLAQFSVGVLAAVALGALADRWGYGFWNPTPWLYFKANLVDGVAAQKFGTDPVFAYLYLLPVQFFFAITLVVMAGMVAMWLRNPRHVLTWISLPFVLVHMALGHKEARFLFPLAIMATAFPVLGFSPHLARGREWVARAWAWRSGWMARIVTGLSVAGMVVLAVYPFGFRPHLPMAKYVYRHFEGGISAYSTDVEPFESYPLYRPRGFQVTKMTSLDSLADKGSVYLFAERPSLNALPSGMRATLIYSEFPFAGLGYDRLGSAWLDAVADFSSHAGRFLKLPCLSWITLYRLERTTRS